MGTYVFLTAMLPIFVDVGDKLVNLWKMTIGFKQSSEILVHEDLSKWVSLPYDSNWYVITSSQYLQCEAGYAVKIIMIL